MVDLINKFLPLRPARVRRSVLSPWFHVECRALRRQARRLERLYRRTRFPVDGCTLCEICTVATEIKSVRIGRPGSPPTPKTRSVYGLHLTPSLVGAKLTHSLMLHHFQLMIFWLRSRRR